MVGQKQTKYVCYYATLTIKILFKKKRCLWLYFQKCSEGFCDSLFCVCLSHWKKSQKRLYIYSKRVWQKWLFFPQVLKWQCQPTTRQAISLDSFALQKQPPPRRVCVCIWSEDWLSQVCWSPKKLYTNKTNTLTHFNYNNTHSHFSVTGCV